MKHKSLLLEYILVMFGIFIVVLIVPAIITTIFAALHDFIFIRAGLFFFLIGLYARCERYEPLVAKYIVKNDAIFGFQTSEETAIKAAKTSYIIMMTVGILIIAFGLLKDYLAIKNPAYLLICVFIVLNLTALALNGYLKKKAFFRHLNNKIYRIGFIGGCIVNIVIALWALNTIHWS